MNNQDKTPEGITPNLPLWSYQLQQNSKLAVRTRACHQSIEPDNRSSQINRAEEVDRPLVITGRNRSILLEFSKEVFNQMPSFVQVFVILTGRRAIAFGWNHRRFPLGFKSLNHTFICIIGFIGKHGIGNQVRQELVGSIQVTGLPRGEVKAQGVAQGIGHGMNLGTQSAFAAT